MGVTFSPQPGAVHTKVWETIRNDQSVAHALDSDLSRELQRTIAARGIVANIEMYVISIQNKNK